MRKITQIILHCSATPEGKNYSVDTIRKWHLANGWADIGYHYVIYLDGSIHEGRPIEMAGAHTTGQNSNSIGICYIGGVATDGKTPKDTRTPEQKKSLEWLCRKLMQDYPTITEIHGHYEYAAKACPSFDVAFWLRTLHLESCINLIKKK